MKIIVIPNNLEEIKQLKNVDGYILPIENLSSNFKNTFSLEQIIPYLESNKEKEIFIALNKNMHNQDLSLLEYTLKTLEQYKIQGILYYDIALVNLKNKLHLKNALVWSQEHMTTNYYTSNFWEKYGSKYTYLSNEITMQEIEEIAMHTKTKTLVQIFGYIPMFTSKRKLVKNYTDFFNLSYKKQIYYMEKEQKKYPILENEQGTVVYNQNILNAIKEKVYLEKIGIQYGVIHSLEITTSQLQTIINLFQTVTEENKEEYNQKIEEMFSNTDQGFLYTSTIYKIKK